MGTKVMVRASRSFNGYVEGDWYWVDPGNPQEAALIRGGYLEHQEELFEGLTVETIAGVEDDGTALYPVSPGMRVALDERYVVEYPPLDTLGDNRQERLDAVMKLYEPLEESPDGEVEAEPGEHPQDGTGAGLGAGDPDGAAGAGRGEADSPEQDGQAA